MGGKSSRQNTLQSIVKDRSFDPYSLPLEDLRKITDNFSDERLLGQGGFGKVYKGVVPNGDTIAVKKLLSTAPGLNDRQLENEVHLLMRLNHPNIVQLVGYCSETEIIPVRYNGKHVYAEKLERLLCLEYLPKGSLNEHLSDESSGLDWDTRYNIIEGICYGLHHLHEEWNSNTPIIHMDLKPPNILLDDNMVPKITDFGLSRLFGQEQTRSITRSCNGTLGYMAPEYLNGGVITKKLDIFSLGVIIIEIMTGHKDYPYDTETYPQKFIELVLKNWINRLVKASGYPSPEIDHCQQIRRCIQIGLTCVKHDWKKRPTTHQIIKMLQGSEGVECTNTREKWLAISSGTDHIGALLCSLCSPDRGEQRFAAAQLRLLAQRGENNRICIAEAGAIPLLLTLLSSSDQWTQEQAVAALAFLTLHEDNKARIMSSGAVPSIVHVLKNGSMKGREYAAETLHRLSMVDEYKVTIGEREAIPALVVLLSEGSQRGKKNAVAALFYLCIYQGNKGRAIRAGLVPLIMGLVTDRRGDLTEEAMEILAVLSRHPLGNAAIRAVEPIPVLVQMIRRGTPKNRENAVDVMLQLCSGEHQLVHLTRAQKRGIMALLRVMALHGTERGKKNAGQLLERISRFRVQKQEEPGAPLQPSAQDFPPHMRAKGVPSTPVAHGPPPPSPRCAAAVAAKGTTRAPVAHSPAPSPLHGAAAPASRGAPRTPMPHGPPPLSPHRAATVAAKGAPRSPMAPPRPHRAAASAMSWLPPPTLHRHHSIPTPPRFAPSSSPAAHSPPHPSVHAPLSPTTLARLHQAVTLPLPPQALPSEVHCCRRREATAASPPHPHSAAPSGRPSVLNTSSRSAREMGPRQPRNLTSPVAAAAREGVRGSASPSPHRCQQPGPE